MCKADVPHAAELFFSLLGVIVTFDPVGWGVPYVGSFSSDLPVRQLDMSAQVRMQKVLGNGEALWGSQLPRMIFVCTRGFYTNLHIKTSSKIYTQAKGINAVVEGLILERRHPVLSVVILYSVFLLFAMKRDYVCLSNLIYHLVMKFNLSAFLVSWLWGLGSRELIIDIFLHLFTGEISFKMLLRRDNGSVGLDLDTLFRTGALLDVGNTVSFDLRNLRSPIFRDLR